MKKAMGIITAIDARYMVTVVALVAALALPKLSRHSRKLHAAKVPAGIVVVGHLRPRRKFPSSGPNRPAAIAARDHERAVLDALRRVLRVTRTAGADTIKRGGLTPAQVAALQALNCPESVSMNQVAERTMTSASSASEVVSRLVAQGLVLRNRSRADGRSVELTLSDAGRAAIAQASASDAGLQAGLARMAIEDKRELSRLLGQLIGKMDFPSADGEPEIIGQVGPADLSDPRVA
ncbi:MAG TPA: MarR family transcriptional regulator [Tepidisphaeraceae bacterium]|nr:MarR family transcriptional regulator [Tepidisphaeraceae bacterium]